MRKFFVLAVVMVSISLTASAQYQWRANVNVGYQVGPGGQPQVYSGYPNTNWQRGGGQCNNNGNWQQQYPRQQPTIYCNYCGVYDYSYHNNCPQIFCNYCRTYDYQYHYHQPVRRHRHQHYYGCGH